MRQTSKPIDDDIAALHKALASIGVTNVSVADTCLRCGHHYQELERVCKNCNTEFWCEWNSLWYESRMTMISLGQDHRARWLGNTFSTITAMALLIAAAMSHLQASSPQAPVGIVLTLVFGGCSIYDVWAYCHGRTTSIDSLWHTAKPANTPLRTFGLMLDFVAMAVAFYVLIRMR